MTVPNSLFSKMIMTIWEKFGTSGTGVRVGSSVGVDVGGSFVTIAGVNVGKGCGVVGRGEGVDPVGAGWQAEATNDAMTVIQNKRVIIFMLESLLRDYKSKIQMH